MSTYYETELCHHGVKSQKWGVWNKETRARYTSSSSESTVNKVLASSNKKYASLDGTSSYGKVKKKQGVYIPKGSELARMTGVEREKSTKGAAYYAINKQDANKYKRINLQKQLIAEKTGKNMNEWGGRYQTKSVLKEDLLAPTKDDARKALGEVLKDKDAQKAMINAMNNQANGRFHMNTKVKQIRTEADIRRAGRTGKASNQLLNRLSNVSGEGRNAAIKEMNKSQGLKTESIRDEFYNNLTKKGYNAILDYNDMGKVSSAPIIVINKNKTVYTAAGKDIVKEYHDRKVKDLIA